MVRFIYAILFANLLLSACGKSTRNGEIVRETIPDPAQYTEIVTAFVNQCVLAKGASIPTIRGLYVISETKGKCTLKTNTYWDHDTDIAALMDQVLKQTDPRFAKMKQSFIGISWKIGDNPSWSASSGEPLITLGRQSQKSKLRIQRFGSSL